MTLPVDIVLVRHGESEGNAAKRAMEKGDQDILERTFVGRHTSSFLLSPKGVAQAEIAGQWLREEFADGFGRYMVSDYKRAMQTAGLLELPNARWYRNMYLVERDWGELDRFSDKERQEKFAYNMSIRDSEPFYWKPGGSGESFGEVCLRLDRGVVGTLHRKSRAKRVILVCHGEVMWGFRCIFERMPQERFKELHLSRNPDHRIHNCQVIHYSRRDPVTGEVSPYIEWMRMIRPTENPVRIFPWEKIVRPVYSNEDLLRLTSGTVPAAVE